MAKAATPEEFLKDGIGPLDGGTNTGLVPQLLPANQVSMSTNMTFRGGYGTHRPPIREIALDFKGDAVLEQNVIRQPFQGACFYQPDSGNQSIVASIGGKLFQFFPQGTTSPVLDISIPNDPNPLTPQQAWLWQCERFVVVNDGVSLPIFFDGNISRRSNGPNKVLATLTGPFTIPAVGSAVQVTVTQPYTGPLNVPVIINGAQYTVVSSRIIGGDDATTQYLFGAKRPSVNSPIDSQTPILSYPGRLGGLNQTLPAGTVDIKGTTFNGIRVLVSELMDANGNKILPPGNAGNLNIPIQIGNEAFVIFAVTRQFHPQTGAFDGPPTIAMHLVQTFPGQNKTLSDHGLFSIISQVTSAPTVQLAELAEPIVVHQTNSFPTAPIFTYPQQVVWMDDSQFLITPIPNPISNTLVLVNVSGNPGDQMAGNITAMPELPPGRMGVYGLGRNWMALTDGTGFIASDIVGGSSGTVNYNLRDAPLRITENLLLAGGGAFRVPGAVGDIRAMRFSATLDVSLGQGPLQVFTTMAAFSCNAPTDRTTWSNVTNPILTQSLIGAGALSQSSTVLANGDIIFRAVDGIRSLILARREFDTWGNVPQSREVETILAQDDPTLTQFESAAVIENRTLMTILPSNGPLGVFCQGIIALNFDPISTLRGKAPSIYDGLWTGMNVLQLVQGVFNGVDRCYAFCFDGVQSRIRLFEIQKTLDNPFDNTVTPVTYSMESAALFKDPKIKNEFDLCELLDGELYLSDVRGVVNFEVWYRPNYSDCWTKWTEFGICANNTDPTKPMQYRSPIGLGSPSVQDCDPNTGRPCRIGLTFQVRFQVSGACKIRGARFKAKPVVETLLSVPKCKPLCDAIADAAQQDCEPCVDQPNCLQFPLVLYNLNANKTYSNELTVVDVTCPDNSVQQVPVPAGTINYTLPFSPGFTGTYPPLIMNCLSGGVIVQTIPSGATQDQIDVIVNDMISQCVVAYAQTLAQCGSTTKIYSSEQVTTTHTCPPGSTFSFTGTLPSWISIDFDTGVITGNAGVITSQISVADATAQAQAALNQWAQDQVTAGTFVCFTGPSCLTNTGTTFPTFVGGDPSGPFNGTYSAAFRKAVLVFPSDSRVVFIDTATNAVSNTITLATGYTPGFRYHSIPFATSTQNFLFVNATYSAMTVTDINGNTVGTISPPVGTNFSRTPWAYSPDTDKFYTLQFFAGTGTDHILEYDPHTLGLTRNIDTGTSISGSGGVMCYPGNLVAWGVAGLYNFPLSTLIQDKQSPFFQPRGTVAYDPVSNRLFVGQSFSNDIQAFNVSDFSLSNDFSGVNVGPYDFVVYNPVSKAIIGMTAFAEMVVIDPSNNTIICEFTPDPNADGLVVDYSSGNVYFYQFDDANNAMLVYH